MGKAASAYEKLFSDRREIIVVLLAILSLLISCAMISAKKYYWNDELYSWYFLSDESFASMWRAFNDKINNTPALYFVVGWLWARIFGASELSLRLFSSLGFCAALILTWITLRKTYSFWPVSLGVLTVFCTSEIVLSQNAEARMYGLFLCLGAAALLHYDRLNRLSKCGFWDALVLCVIHVSIIHTHLFGPFYSAAFLGAFVVADIIYRRLRPSVYIAIFLSWLSFLLYVPAFLIQSDAGRPRSWLPIPSLRDLVSLVSLSSVSFLNVFFVFLLGLLLIGCLLIQRKFSFKATKRSLVSVSSQETSLLILTAFFLAIPFGVWVVSQAVRPIFWDRYMIPTILGYSILITFVFSKLFEHSLWGRKSEASSSKYLKLIYSGQILPFAMAVFLSATLLYPLLYAKSYQGRALPGVFDDTYGYDSLPIVVQASAQFLERMHYSPNRDRYYFVLDEEAAFKDESGLFGIQEHKHLKAFRRNYPEQLRAHILDSDKFLAKFDRFLILDSLPHTKACPTVITGLDHARYWKDMHCPQWVEHRLLSNPDYQVESLGEIWQEEILLVTKES